MLGLTESEVREMLQELGVESIDDLFKEVPDKYKREVPLPEPLEEWEAEEVVSNFFQAITRIPRRYVFLGAGIYFHHIPAEVDFLANRGEFLTAYTPYQPEVSQGSLQAMWEYQSLMCDLLKMDVCNASHYDGATATSEAMLMAVRIKNKSSVAVSSAVNPFWKMVLHTYAWGKDVKIHWLPYDQETGRTKLEELPDDVAGLIIQQPNFFGVIEDLGAAREITSRKDQLLIVTNSEPLAWALIKPPGDYDADIAVGSAQSFGIYPSYGGPSLGYMAAKEKYLRQMPGRIIGETVDEDGNRAYTMILQTREQHIRRERATSNICTNQALMAIRVAIYLGLYGKTGLRNLAIKNWRNARRAAETLVKTINYYNGEEVARIRFSAPFFNEFVLQVKGLDMMRASMVLSQSSVLAGLPLGFLSDDLKDSLLLTVTEVNTEDAIELLAFLLKDITRKMRT